MVSTLINHRLVLVNYLWSNNDEKLPFSSTMDISWYTDHLMNYYLVLSSLFPNTLGCFLFSSMNCYQSSQGWPWKQLVRYPMIDSLVENEPFMNHSLVHIGVQYISDDNNDSFMNLNNHHKLFLNFLFCELVAITHSESTTLLMKPWSVHGIHQALVV